MSLTRECHPDCGKTLSEHALSKNGNMESNWVTEDNHIFCSAACRAAPAYCAPHGAPKGRCANCDGQSSAAAIPSVGDETACLSTDLSQLGREAREHVAFLAFSEAMKGRAYGTEALSTAWSWFSEGYAAGREQGARGAVGVPVIVRV